MLLFMGMMQKVCTTKERRTTGLLGVTGCWMCAIDHHSAACCWCPACCTWRPPSMEELSSHPDPMVPAGAAPLGLPRLPTPSHYTQWRLLGPCPPAGAIAHLNSNSSMRSSHGHRHCIAHPAAAARHTHATLIIVNHLQAAPVCNSCINHVGHLDPASPCHPPAAGPACLATWSALVQRAGRRGR